MLSLGKAQLEILSFLLATCTVTYKTEQNIQAGDKKTNGTIDMIYICFPFCFMTERYLLVSVLAAVASSLVPALQGMNRVMMSPRKQQTIEEDC